MTRTDIINELLTLFPEPRTYLEVGSSNGVNFDAVRASVKHDIEPKPDGRTPTWAMTSDEAFKAIPRNPGHFPYDVVFVDGLHHCEQVAMDVCNACRVLAPDGFIVIHDCLPKAESDQVRDYPGGFVNWTGDVWKFQAWLVATFRNVVTVDEDWGCRIVWGPIDFIPPTYESLTGEFSAFTWERYARVRDELMRTVKWTSLSGVLRKMR